MNGNPVETQNIWRGKRGVHLNFASLQQQQQQQPTGNKFGPQSKNLASVIRGFKIGVTKFANENNIPFAWQPRFYDRIIRNTDEMNRIAEYIEGNVARWGTQDEIFLRNDFL